MGLQGRLRYSCQTAPGPANSLFTPALLTHRVSWKQTSVSLSDPLLFSNSQTVRKRIWQRTEKHLDQQPLVAASQSPAQCPGEELRARHVCAPSHLPFLFLQGGGGAPVTNQAVLTFNVSFRRQEHLEIMSEPFKKT